MSTYIFSDSTSIEYYIAGNNCKIISAYLIKDKKLKLEFIQFLRENYPGFKERSEKSYYREWKAHNILYKLGIKPSSTADTDLSIDEKLILRAGYFIIAIFPDK